jgi:hypothetical protein
MELKRCPKDIQSEVDLLTNRGLDLQLLEAGGQCYVLAGIEAPSPPWDHPSQHILIAIPAAYRNAGLDAFYLGLPYKFKDSAHPSVNGGLVAAKDRQWQLVSWHYKDGKAWVPGQDNLDSHIIHCKGFFLHRGAINVY